MTRHDVVTPELDRLLVQWAKWARGKDWVNEFLVRCKSIESKFLAPAGDVFLSPTEALEASLRQYEKGEAIPVLVEVEKAVMRLPEKHRSAVRLEYVVYKRLPLVAKRRILACTETEYWLLVGRGTTMVRNLLTHYSNSA